MHRDISAENIFLNDLGIVKIGDFGVSKQLTQTKKRAYTTVGREQYSSPEIYQGKPYTYKTDTWSAGVLFYFIFAGYLPFDDIAAYRMVNLIVESPPPPFKKQINP